MHNDAFKTALLMAISLLWIGQWRFNCVSCRIFNWCCLCITHENMLTWISTLSGLQPLWVYWLNWSQIYYELIWNNEMGEILCFSKAVSANIFRGFLHTGCASFLLISLMSSLSWFGAVRQKYISWTKFYVTTLYDRANKYSSLLKVDYQIIALSILCLLS